MIGCMSMVGDDSVISNGASVRIFGMDLRVTAATMAGRRSENQDFFGWVASSGGTVTGATPDGPVENGAVGLPDFLLAVVCDGLGGMRDGDMASRLVTESLVSWASDGGLADGDPISGIVGAAMRTEDRLMSRHPRSGTTMSVVAAVGGKWLSAHLGDSRCYAVYPGETRRTRDHSPVERMFREGRITEDAMNTHPMSNVMDRCMGNLDAADTEVRDIAEGWTRLALCSDGAFGYMTVGDFDSVLRSSVDAEGMVRSAFGSGSTDNITVLTIDRGPSHIPSERVRSNVQIK